MATSTVGRLLNSARIRAPARWRMGPETHDYHQWLIVSRGVAFVRLNGREYRAGAGDCLFYARGRSHEEWTDPAHPHESYGICFSWDGPAGDMPVCLPDSLGRMRVLAAWLNDEWPRHWSDSASLRHHYFQGILTEWLRLGRDRQDPLVSRVREHIRANIGSPLTLNNLAAVAGLSRSHFSRTYHRLAGRSVSADLRALRLEYPQALLLSSSLPIKDVAVRSGLVSQHYLNRVLRRYLNVTPGELRRCRPASMVPDAAP